MDAFAEYYDSLVGADYNKISEFLIASIKKYKPDSTLICDLGCGTAKVTTALAKMGYDMIGIDSSEDMLISARDNISKSGITDVLLLNQDITDFELYGTVDVIYSTLDTINYITDKRSLVRLFKLVKNYLNYDGLFIFDINTDYKFNNILANQNYTYDEEDLFFNWYVDFEKNTGNCYHYLTYFKQNNEGMYERFDSVQHQRFYDKNYIESLCAKFNFEIIRCVDDYSCKQINDCTERITYVLKINK